MRRRKRRNGFVGLMLSCAAILFIAGIAVGAELSVPEEFKSIGDAIAKASEGDTVKVAPGTYKENVVLKSGVTLTGAGVGKSIIDGGGSGSVVICKDRSVIQGFTIRNSGKVGRTGQVMDAGIKIDHAVAVVEKNRIISSNAGIVLNYASQSQILNNDIFDNNHYGIYILYSKPVIKNNQLAKNKAFGVYSGYAEPKLINNVITQSATLIFSEVSQVTAKNNILTDGENGIQVAESWDEQKGAKVSPSISYNLLWSNKTSYAFTKPGRGDISADPMFIDAEKYNFRLKKGSPAIDAGDSFRTYLDQDGSPNDIGAFGGPLAMLDAGVKKKKTVKKSKWFTGKKKKFTEMDTGGWDTMKTTDEMHVAKGNYLLFCSACHGEKGDGAGDIAGRTETPPRDHTDGVIMSAISDEELYKIISEGGEAAGYSMSMPGHKTVMPEADIRGMVKYIRKLCDCKYEGQVK